MQRSHAELRISHSDLDDSHVAFSLGRGICRCFLLIIGPNIKYGNHIPVGGCPGSRGGVFFPTCTGWH